MESCQAIIVGTPKLKLKDIEKSIIKTYRKDIFTPFVKAINEYELIKENDKIAVAVSGGKDSLILAKLFQELKRHNKINFELVFIAMDPGFNSINREFLESNTKYLKIPLTIAHSEIFKVVGKIAKENPCYLCARMRRGFLYNEAKKLGCNKLALGHHFNDVIETTLMNMFYNGQFMTMLPKIRAENFSDMELIRPMVFIKEKAIIRWIKHSGIQAMNCGCTVAAQKTASKRLEMKKLIEELKKDNPDVDQAIYKSAANVNLETILGHHKNNKQKVHFNEMFDERRKK